MLRRDVLRLLSLSTLAVTAAPLLAGCGDADPSAGGSTGTGGPVGSDEVELVSADVARTEGDAKAVPGVVAAMHATGGALFGSLVAESDGNLAISPYSITSAMALTANGAKGKTLEQLELVLGGTGIEEVNGGLNALTTHLEGLAGPVKKYEGTEAELVLDAANALFGQRGFTWGEPFLETLAASYGAGMNVVDWAGDTEAARQAVNTWTAKQTRDKIEEILAVDAVTPETRLVLVNTLYLKAPWERPFDKELTEGGTFTLADGSTVEVPLMTGYDPVADAYAEGGGWTAARLPFAGRGVAMTVVLPDEGRFDDVQDQLVAGGAADVLEAFGRSTVAGVVVTLPSWTFKAHHDLVEAMVALGVEAPFDAGAADLSPMTADAALFVARIEHEVFIAVDEEGAEAAAATAVVVVPSSAPSYEKLVADRPFLFVIHDLVHGTPLFLGRVLDPRPA